MNPETLSSTLMQRNMGYWTILRWICSQFSRFPLQGELETTTQAAIHYPQLSVSIQSQMQVSNQGPIEHLLTKNPGKGWAWSFQGHVQDNPCCSWEENHCGIEASSDWVTRLQASSRTDWLLAVQPLLLLSILEKVDELHARELANTFGSVSKV